MPLCGAHSLVAKTTKPKKQKQNRFPQVSMHHYDELSQQLFTWTLNDIDNEPQHDERHVSPRTAKTRRRRWTHRQLCIHKCVTAIPFICRSNAKCFKEEGSTKTRKDPMVLVVHLINFFHSCAGWQSTAIRNSGIAWYQPGVGLFFIMAFFIFTLTDLCLTCMFLALFVAYPFIRQKVVWRDQMQ